MFIPLDNVDKDFFLHLFSATMQIIVFVLFESAVLPGPVPSSLREDDLLVYAKPFICSALL